MGCYAGVKLELITDTGDGSLKKYILDDIILYIPNYLYYFNIMVINTLLSKYQVCDCTFSILTTRVLIYHDVCSNQ